MLISSLLLKQVVANFSATWCGPCKIVAPFFIELSEKHSSLMFLLVDVDELSVSNSYSVYPYIVSLVSLSKS